MDLIGKPKDILLVLTQTGLFEESCICDGGTRAVNQSYVCRSRKTDANWSGVGPGVGLSNESYTCVSGTVTLS